MRALGVVAATALGCAGSTPRTPPHDLVAAGEALAFPDVGISVADSSVADSRPPDSARDRGAPDRRAPDTRPPGPDLCPTVVLLPKGKDCVTASCPSCAPYPSGCQLVFSGNDGKGCVANAPGSPTVFFKEGDQCDSGSVTGQLYCAAKPGGPLGPINCPISRPTPIYAPSPGGCP
jgi:hypothetical protein